MTTGSYTATFGTGLRMRIEGMTADEIGLRPAKLQFASLMAIIDAVPPPGTTPTPAQLRDLFEKVAGLYEGVYLGGAEVRGLSIETPEGPFRLAAIRLGKLDNGKLAEFALEGLDARSPQGPVKVGRFALKSLDVANLMRFAAQFSASGAQPDPGSAGRAGAAARRHRDSRAWSRPTRTASKPVNIDTLNLSWGQFVGPIPTRARATLKMSGPVDVIDPDPFRTLASAGIDNTSINFDLGAAWTEGTRAFALEPVTLEIGSVLHGGGAPLGRQCSARGVFDQPAAGRHHGGADRGRADRARAARRRRRRSRGRAICPHAERQPRRGAPRDDRQHPCDRHDRWRPANPDAMAIAGAHRALHRDARAAP